MRGMKRVTIDTFPDRKRSGPPITMVTAYDAPTARLLSQSGIDVALVGDSLGMVVQGRENTLSVTLDEMIYHTRMVARGLDGPLLVSDMPFLSYSVSKEEALRNAGRMIKEAGCHAVKLEGGVEIASTVRFLTQAMVPVMGHIGMKPMNVHSMGGFKIQGRDPKSAAAILDDAMAVAEAGAFAIVLEAIPETLARKITEAVPVPTFGIGAGSGTDGQVLVFHDLVGWTPAPLPRFARAFGNVADVARSALMAFRDAVTDGSFPAPGESYTDGPAGPPKLDRMKTKRKG
jgi:3-methyl-2-oxobutanoate hydroxymethyltransferase